MRGLTLADVQLMKAKMIPPWVQNAAQFQRDIAMNYYVKAMELIEHAEKQTVHKAYLRFLKYADDELVKYARHIRVADRLVRT